MVDDPTADSPLETAVASPDIAAAVPVAEAAILTDVEEQLPAPPVERNEAEIVPPPTLEDRVEIGSILERTKSGWHVKLHYGGQTRLFGNGATIDAAITNAGR